MEVMFLFHKAKRLHQFPKATELQNRLPIQASVPAHAATSAVQPTTPAALLRFAPSSLASLSCDCVHDLITHIRPGDLVTTDR